MRKLYRITVLSLVLSFEVLAQPFAGFPYNNKNEASVGDNIDALSDAGTLNSDASLLSAVNAALSLSVDGTNHALNQFHPAPYSAFSEWQAAFGGQLLTAFHRRAAPSCCCSSSWRIWGEPFGNWLEEKKVGQQLGFTINSKGVAAGIDWEIFNGWVVGGGFAWNDGHLHWDLGRGRGTVNTYYGALYTDYTTDNVYVGASFLAGWDLYHTSRQIQYPGIDLTARANHSGTELMGQIATAVFFGPSMCFAFPYFNLDLMYLQQDAINEQGAPGLNLNVDSNSETTVRTEAGLALQVQDTNRANTLCVSPLVALGWAMECPIHRQKYTATFENQTIPFTVKGWDYTWQLFTVRFGFTISYRCWSLFSGYVAELSPLDSTPYFDQRGDIRLEFAW